MDQTLRDIVSRQIATSRANAGNRLNQRLREALEAAAEAGAIGGSRLAIQADQLVATNLLERAQKNLDLVEAAAASGRQAWDPAFGDSATEFLASELTTDNGEVSTLLTEFQKRHSTEYTGMLEAAHATAKSDTETRVELLVYSSDINRHPILSRLRATRYADVRSGWEAAMAAAESSKPDWKEAARNAIGAVEELARLLTGKPNQTLGDAIKTLLSSGRIAPALAKTLDGAWGWASTHVRHGSKPARKVDPDEAAYVYRTCEGALHLLCSADT